MAANQPPWIFDACWIAAWLIYIAQPSAAAQDNPMNPAQPTEPTASTATTAPAATTGQSATTAPAESTTPHAAAGQSPTTSHAATASSTFPANRLSHATSPYLQQHAHNPVDWFEWGPEALEKARRESKPIFLSIGYSACHWCHVMAHESFESADVAAVMNRLFVNIKVDREERPDLDEIYMQATMMFNNGQGGWPMSVWLTPDLKPFYAGTYFPPESRWGRPGFRELSERIGELWRDRRDDLLKSADEAAGALTRSLAASDEPSAGDRPTFAIEHLDRTVALLTRMFDAEKGGLPGGGGNKFPPSMAMDLMLRFVRRTSPSEPGAAATSFPPAPSAAATGFGGSTSGRSAAQPFGLPPRAPSSTAPGSDRSPEGRPAERERADVLARVTTTLDRMAAGGIYDQLAGGICRYSTDPDWLVPHFEKMLYDQALVSRIYLDAYQVTKQPLYARIAHEIFDYVIADLQSPAGGFYSTRDADSEGEEGKYYVWTRGEIIAALGPDDGALFCSYYDVSDAGNWDDPHAPGVPKNILHAAHDIDTAARLNRVAPAELERRLAAGRGKLLEIRAKRLPPHRDEKILVEWNGLMIASLARGGCVLGDRAYIEAAARAADFILAHQYRNGRLFRSYRDGRALEMAFLPDYACLIEGLIELYEATFEKRWIEAALELNSTVNRYYHDDKNGGYFFTPSDHEQLIARTKDVRDSAVPSGNSVQLMNLLRLAVMTGDESLRRIADQSMSCFSAGVLSSPGASERYLAAVEFALLGPVEIAISGDPADARTAGLLKVVYESYLPNRVVMLADPSRLQTGFSIDEGGARRPPPLLDGRALVNGAPAAYVCRNFACKLPVTTPDALAGLLRR